MPGYELYTDQNGVRWRVPPAMEHGWSLMAFVAPDEERTYDPAPPDLMAATPAPDDVGKGITAPTGDQSRVIFVDLVKKIEDYAAAHKADVTLVVRASAGTPWWVWGLLGLAVLGGGRRRR